MGSSPERETGQHVVRDGALLAVLECLIAQPHSDVDTLAGATSLDSRAVAVSIAELESLGIARPVEGGGWSVVHPDVALGGILSDRERRAARHLDQLAETRRLAQRFTQVFTDAGRGPVSQHVVTLRDRQEVMERLATLEREVEDEVCSMMTALPSEEAISEGVRMDKNLLARGVTLRMVCLESFYRDAVVTQGLRASVGMGVRIRTRPTLPSSKLLLDRTIAVRPLDPEAPSSSAVLIELRGVVTLLHSLFEQCWKEAEPLTDANPTHVVAGPRPIELAVLNLMALGHKDEAIARSTGQSTRTIRRVVSGLAITLNARSRFDLALRAAARGWIDSPFD